MGGSQERSLPQCPTAFPVPGAPIIIIMNVTIVMININK